MSQIIVAGFGCAGYHAVKAMRDGGYDGEILVCTDSPQAPYNPMLTTYYVSGKIERSGQLPFGTLDEIARRYDLTLCRQRVEQIKAAERVVCLKDGTERRFERLLISTGARAFAPKLTGSTGRDVYLMRTMEDADLLCRRLERGDVRSAVVVGASMTGIKLVELLHKRGVRCVLADAAQNIFPLSTLPETAERIEAHLRENHVDLLFGAGLTEIREQKDRLEVIFSNGEQRAADLVALCIGTRANTELVDTKEIAVDRGILVDEHMRTSAEHVYAAGDCSAGENLQTGRHQIIGLWANAGLQGECAGRNMIGVDCEYHGTILHNITGVFGTYFVGLGDNRCDGQRRTFTSLDRKIWVETVRGHDRLECVNLWGGYEISGVIKAIFVRQLTHPEIGLTAAETGRLRAAGLPEELLAELGVEGFHDGIGKEEESQNSRT